MEQRCKPCHGSGKLDWYSIQPKTCPYCFGKGKKSEENIIPVTIKKKKIKKQAEIML